MPTETGRAVPIVRRAPRLLLALLTVAAFANAIPNGFVWIDHWQVESGGLIVRSWSDLWASLRQPLGAMPGWEGSPPYARPAVVWALSLVHWVADTHPAAFHCAVVLLHLGNVLLTYGLLRDLGVVQMTSLLATIIFAIHPLQTAAVSWISGIADPLFTLGVLAALRLQLAAAAQTTGARALRVAAVACFAVAVTAKETAIALPFLIVGAYLLMPLGRAVDAPHTAGRLGRAVAPLLIVLVGDLLYRIVILHAGALGGRFDVIPLSVRLRTMPRLVLSYLTLPFRFGSLTICDDYVLSDGWDGWTILSWAALVALVAALLRWCRRAPQVVFGVTWMLLALVPVLNIAPILHYRADRFFYFPLIGWSLACVTVLDHAATALGRRHFMTTAQLRHAGTLVASAVAIALLVLTVRRNALFADDLTLFEHTVRVSPLCREARTALGDAYLRQGRAADAAAQYEHALAGERGRASYVVLPKVLINLGMAQLVGNDFAAALDAFSRAHQLQPGLLHPLFGLGVANLGLGRVVEAAAWLEQAYAIDASDPDVVFNLALSYDRLGRWPEARPLYERYLRMAPRGRARDLAEARLRASGTIDR